MQKNRKEFFAGKRKKTTHRFDLARAKLDEV